MSRISGKDTKPEILVRKWLWAHGFRYRLHRKDLPGKPDIVFPAMKKVIFIHGCFWHKHRCQFFKWPVTNREFWRDKIGGTVKRDKRNQKQLQEMGWGFLIVWECETKGTKMLSLESKLTDFLKPSLVPLK